MVIDKKPLCKNKTFHNGNFEGKRKTFYEQTYLYDNDNIESNYLGNIFVKDNNDDDIVGEKYLGVVDVYIDKREKSRHFVTCVFKIKGEKYDNTGLYFDKLNEQFCCHMGNVAPQWRAIMKPMNGVDYSIEKRFERSCAQIGMAKRGLIPFLEKNRERIIEITGNHYIDIMIKAVKLNVERSYILLESKGYSREEIELLEEYKDAGLL